MDKPSLYSFTLSGLQSYFVENGLPKFAASQVYNWLYHNWNFDIESWSNVSKKVKAHILEEMDMELPKVVWHGLSKDGTRKFLVGMRDAQTVETVAIPAQSRLTLCLSSQVGCAIGCTFCHTGTMGLKRHLKQKKL